jgi:hypothetical protein
MGKLIAGVKTTLDGFCDHVDELAKAKTMDEDTAIGGVIMEKQFLESFTGQTTDELIALKDKYRIDSLILAFEQAIQNKEDSDLSEPERHILAIEAMEREVNNGGWEQFFGNTENEFDESLPQALDAIGCPNTAQLSREAIDASRDGADLEDFDVRYYALSESIEDRLFEYISANADAIKLD